LAIYGYTDRQMYDSVVDPFAFSGMMAEPVESPVPAKQGKFKWFDNGRNQAQGSWHGND
jgi:hypothetical protein